MLAATKLLSSLWTMIASDQQIMTVIGGTAAFITAAHWGSDPVSRRQSVADSNNISAAVRATPHKHQRGLNVIARSTVTARPLRWLPSIGSAAEPTAAMSHDRFTVR